MSHQEHFFLQYMPAVFTSPQSPVSWGDSILVRSVYVLDV